MDARRILADLRHGISPEPQALIRFIEGLTDGAVSDALVGAFAMGVCTTGLSPQGRTALTMAMRDSGHVLKWDLDGPVVDKHSTGGVGDCVSFVVAPALAACGAYAPLLSGRGLGHTGGTLDKLESIPGVSTQVSEDRLRAIIDTAGCAIVGATGDIAPADKRLYAIRDVTSTVDSLDLITASILSKKLAAGTQTLVLDVKTGSGAFMKSRDAARDLARALTDTANAAGCKTRAVISDMSQPLAPAIGNALEIEEAMKVLSGQAEGPLLELSVKLGGMALSDAGLVTTDAEGEAKIRAAVADGGALDRFGRMIVAMGGPLGFAESWQRFLPEADVISEAGAPRAGYVTAIDGQALGLASVALGGGRMVETDTIDPAVGFSCMLGLGARVDAGSPLAVVHAAREDAADAAVAAIRAAYTIGDAAPPMPALIHETLG
ncbi:MAG: thymidine phosphorylase [Rhodobacteraceae bacterium]|nr:thymidine phosphorylase [Paracoccaceae bacterium]MAY45524.1 thymidine phosphorylase [Paracoccaceae bacterium]